MIAVAGVRVRLVAERLEHEREARAAGSPIERMNDSNSVIARASRFERVSKTPAIPERALVVGRELAPARDRAQAGLRELELGARSRVARSAGAGSSESIAAARNSFAALCELLALERDVAEQQVRIDLDLRVAVATGGADGGAAGQSERGEQKWNALHAGQYNPGVRGLMPTQFVPLLVRSG